MATTKDYYEILGVPKNAAPDQIKQAYRKLAREHHPDVVKDGDKAAAEKRFKEINEAYQVLNDPQKRKMYDQYGHAGANFNGGNAGNYGQSGWGPFTYTYANGAGSNGANPFGDIDPFDIFEEFFGFRGFGGQKAPRKGKNLYYEMSVTFAEAIHGAEKTIKVESGTITIKIPQGASDGTEMRFAGKGELGPNGAPAGDLFITLRVPMPKEFQRQGSTLGVALELEYTQLVLGDVVEVPVVDLNEKNGIGHASLKIPAGTKPGMQFRLRGKGMPILRGRGQGDVIAQVFIRIPNKLSRKQKEILEVYRRTQ